MNDENIGNNNIKNFTFRFLSVTFSIIPSISFIWSSLWLLINTFGVKGQILLSIFMSIGSFLLISYIFLFPKKINIFYEKNQLQCQLYLVIIILNIILSILLNKTGKYIFNFGALENSILLSIMYLFDILLLLFSISLRLNQNLSYGLFGLYFIFKVFVKIYIS